MKAVSGKEFAKILEREGWKLVRVRGSHHIYARAGSPFRISLPVHGNTPLKTGLLKSLIKAAGLDEMML
ncbi:type II toxin-antitoxin system HicA family toxin [Desulfobotulus alkaliphilus]|uniref:type II toxin-antitoxin system HicA family toxin n=1 Tax=Desulfobotulus alkaliphilus TaxID=622671 RepID=UPI0011AB1CE1